MRHRAGRLPPVAAFLLLLPGPVAAASALDVDSVDVTPGGVSIALQPATVVVGQPATIALRLHSDRPLASAAHELAVGPALVFLETPDGHPQCTAAPELAGVTSAFEFLPADCSADGCRRIRTAIAAGDALPDDTLLYTCAVIARGDSPLWCGFPNDCCDHTLGCDGPSVVGTDGMPVAAQCTDGVVHIEYPRPSATFALAVEPPAPAVGDLVHVTIDTMQDSRGFIGRPEYGLRGTDPFLAGDVSTRQFTWPTRVTYELQAVRAGTAELVIGMIFETREGCPGNDFYQHRYLSSDIFPVTIAPAECPGDCDADARVAIDELLTGVRMAFGDVDLSACPAMDRNASGRVEVDDLVAAVTNTLRGCPSPSNPSPSPTRTPMPPVDPLAQGACYESAACDPCDVYPCRPFTASRQYCCQLTESGATFSWCPIEHYDVESLSCAEQCVYPCAGLPTRTTVHLPTPTPNVQRPEAG